MCTDFVQLVSIVYFAKELCKKILGILCVSTGFEEMKKETM